MTAAGWLFDVLGVKDIFDSIGTLLPRRQQWRFLGGGAPTIADNPTLGTTDFTYPAASGNVSNVAAGIVPAVGAQGTVLTSTGVASSWAFLLQLGTSLVAPRVEVATIATKSVLALLRGTAISATQMPANTGDGVAYIANCTTAPTANSVSGGIVYEQAGALYHRGTGGTITPMGPA